MESNINQKLQELKSSKFAKLVAVSDGTIVVIKKRGQKGFNTYKETIEEYKVPYFFNPLKLRENKCADRKKIANIILQSLNFINLSKNKINKPIVSISSFRQCGI